MPFEAERNGKPQSLFPAISASLGQLSLLRENNMTFSTEHKVTHSGPRTPALYICH